MTRREAVGVHAERPYDVVVGSGVLDALEEVLPPGTQRVAILHPLVLGDLAHALARRLPHQTTIIQVPDGEAAKSLDVLGDCWNHLAAAGFTRSDVIVGLGGGSTTDLAGFVAASWLRGVGYVCIPTTVLAMVDAAVGGKTGINLGAGKNLVGAFHEPLGVLADLDLLVGLPAPEVVSGLAEVIKCGLISDPRIIELVQQDPRDATDVTSLRFGELVKRAISVKAEVVTRDLREATSVGGEVGREALNYGHTLGHAIERHENFTWRHGEAISVGMVYAAEVAHRMGYLDADEVGLHRELLASVGLPISYGQDAYPELRQLMSLDKKTRGSRLRLVVLAGIGHPAIADDLDDAVLAAAFTTLADPSGRATR